MAILGKRASQISAELKEELGGKLEEFNTHSKNLEEVFENREQIEIYVTTKNFRKLPCWPSKNGLDDEIYFRHPEEVEEKNKPCFKASTSWSG